MGSHLSLDAKKFPVVTSRNEVVAKVMFLQVCVCPQDQADLPPRTRQPPPHQAATPPPRPGRPPPGPGIHPPGPGRLPPREADCSIRSTSGRYASYWNAFLLLLNSKGNCWHFIVSLFRVPSYECTKCSSKSGVFLSVQHHVNTVYSHTSLALWWGFRARSHQPKI